MAVIQFPKHSHDGGWLHCAVFELIERRFPDIDAIAAAQKIVEVLADLIKYSVKPEGYEGALADVKGDLETILWQKVTFGPQPLPESQ